MNILQVSHSFYPCYQSGGVVKVVYQVSRALVEKGNRVTVITTDGCTQRLAVKKNNEVDIDGIRVWYFRNISNFLRIKFKFATPYFLPIFLTKNIKNFDIIHIHEHRTLLAIITTHYAKKYRIPYIIQSHGSVLPSFKRHGLKKIFDKIFGNKILKNASNLIASTEDEVKQYECMGIPSNKITIIPSGIDLSQFVYLPIKGMFKLKYGIAKEEKLVLFLGRIHKIKGIDLLIEAFSIINKESLGITLVIAGPDDGGTKELQGMVEQRNLGNKVIFTGVLSNQEKISAYIDANVYVLPSIFECFPNTILEAWACETPVIITESCGLSTIAQNAGIVIKRDPIVLAAAIKKIIYDDVLRETICNNGKSLVNNELNIETMITNIEKCYEQNILNYRIQKGVT